MSKKKKTTKFFDFSQNNSGGRFHHNEKAGIGHHVIVEAYNSEEANAVAESIGLYFDGTLDGTDCECCGDRWYPQWETKGKDEPSIYGQDVSKGIYYEDWGGWDIPSYIHYLDGTVKEVKHVQKKA